MKKEILVFIGLAFCIVKPYTSYGQITPQLTVADTRDSNSPPTYYNRQVNFEFKGTGVIQVPSTGIYSGLMTIAPWIDNSGGPSYQISFSQDGLFYRNGMPDGTVWNSWNKLVVQDGNGLVKMGTGGALSGLSVNGNISTKEVIVTTTGWPDYVFNKGYRVPSLDSLKAAINRQGHLPDMPSAKDIQDNGQNLGEMNKLLLKKVEELTLYIIELDKRQQKIEAINKKLLENLNIKSY